MQGQQAVAALGAVICGLIFVLVFGTLVGAVILRAACAFYNKLAGRDNGVPEPGFGKALGIMLATMVANVAAGFAVGVITGGGAAAAGMNAQGAQLMSSLISLPVGFLVLAGMVTFLLPTSFGRGLMVALLDYVIMIAVGVIVGLIIFGLFVAMGIGFGGR